MVSSEPICPVAPMTRIFFIEILTDYRVLLCVVFSVPPASLRSGTNCRRKWGSVVDSEKWKFQIGGKVTLCTPNVKGRHVFFARTDAWFTDARGARRPE